MTLPSDTIRRFARGMVVSHLTMQMGLMMGRKAFRRFRHSVIPLITSFFVCIATSCRCAFRNSFRLKKRCQIHSPKFLHTLARSVTLFLSVRLKIFKGTH
ncbi:MAG: hypothetical protein LUC88_04575 [Prevotella sp.]|nr:hypothetical protein [Prevotella sp.]